jgi:hypothetical protein
MPDIYAELAAAVTSQPSDRVTINERRLAKEAFWKALVQVVELPGNEALVSAIREVLPAEPAVKFADFSWQPRWNKAAGVASLSQSGPDVMAIGFFGVLKFRLDRPDDVAAIVNHARRFADMVEGAAVDYLGG